MKKKKLTTAACAFFILIVTAIIAIYIWNGHIRSSGVDNVSKMQDHENSVTEKVNEVELPENTRYVDNIFTNVDSKTDIQYSQVKNHDGKNESLLLDVYTPSGDEQKNRPVIIWIHGGGYTGGSKENDFEKNMAVEFAKKGYVSININYRLRSSDSDVDFSAVKDSMQDTADAMQWVISNSEEQGIDKNRIIIAGYSAGATTTIHFCYSDLSVYGIDKSKILCSVDMAGGREYTNSMSKSDPPCLVIQGTRDTRISYNDSADFVSKLNAKGIENVFYSIDGAEHNLRTYYDSIVGQITRFLYKNLTGDTIKITEKETRPYECRNIDERLTSGTYYDVKQLDVTVDGKLDEWKNVDVMDLNQLKDAGTVLPDREDFSGTAMVGWNENTPTKVYIAAVITDNRIQDTNTATGKWYNDDCLEIAFDLSQNDFVADITKWVIGTTGKNLSVLATKGNTDYQIIKDNNTYTFEIAIDLSKIDIKVDSDNSKFSIRAGDVIGFSLSYNDSDGDIRKYQIGWTAGKSSSRQNFGNLRFVKESVLRSD